MDFRTYAWRVLFCAGLLSTLASCRTTPPPRPPAPQPSSTAGVSPVVSSAASPAVPAREAFLGVRVLKTEGARDLEWSVELPASCPTCRLEINPFTSAQNPLEFYFHFYAPGTLDQVNAVHLKVNPAEVRGVLVGRTDAAWSKPVPTVGAMEHVAFRTTADGITFDVPCYPKGGQLPPYDSGDVTNQYTYLQTPGVILRIDHANPKRRHGPYATGPWPATEVQAALNLEFAAREAITLLQLDQTLYQQGLGVITLMAFDTNYPTQAPHRAHDDDPPHWHMHLYWSHAPQVRQIGHFGIGPDGLLIRDDMQNVVTRQITAFGRGQTADTFMDTGAVLYQQTVTPEGYFVLGAAGRMCRFAPVKGGFDSGVELTCTDQRPRRIRVEDDLALGRVRVFRDERLVEEHHYDPDTGTLTRSDITYGP